MSSSSTSPSSGIAHVPAEIVAALGDRIFDAQTEHAGMWLPGIMAESVLFGMYTVLMLYVVAVALRRRLKSLTKSVMTLLCAIMYIAALIHWAVAASTANTAYNRMGVTLTAAMLCAPVVVNKTTASFAECPSDEQSLTTPYLSQHLAIFLMINVILSDIIVSWRACIVCAKSRVVLFVSMALVIGTIVTSIYSATTGEYYPPIEIDVTIGFSEGGSSDVWGSVSFVLSWVTNLWAVGAISWKTWQHRRLVRKSLRGSLRTQAEHLMMMFVESGILYCALWTLIAAERIRTLRYHGHNMSSRLDFWDVIQLFRQWGLIDVIGIYPTAVVVLADLVKSHTERTLYEDDIRTPRIAMPYQRSPQHFTSLLETLSAAEAHATPIPDPPVAPSDRPEPSSSRDSLITGALPEVAEKMDLESGIHKREARLTFPSAASASSLRG